MSIYTTYILPIILLYLHLYVPAPPSGGSDAGKAISDTNSPRFSFFGTVILVRAKPNCKMNSYQGHVFQGVGKIASFECTKSEGIIFSFTDKPVETFYLQDDDSVNRLLQRVIPLVDGVLSHEIKHQTIDEAKSILNKVINDGAYVIVRAQTLFGLKLYHVEYSPVPGYAVHAYFDPSTNDTEREELKKFTEYVTQNETFYRAAYGKTVAIVNGEVVPQFFNSPSEIMKKNSSDRIICICVGIVAVEKSQMFLRAVNSKCKCGPRFPVELDCGHTVEEFNNYEDY